MLFQNLKITVNEMKILLDFDEVINTMTHHWVDTLNCVYGTSVNFDDVSEWDMHKAFPTLTEDEIYNPLHLQTFWNGVEIMPGAKEGIQTLLTQGHEIYIVTSTHPDTIKWKSEWLQRELPEISWSHVIVANNKSLVNGDILVDDGLHNLYEGNYIKVLFDKPWNRNVDKSKLTDIIHRVHNWDEIVKFINHFEF